MNTIQLIIGILLYFVIGCIITKIFTKYLIEDDFKDIKENIRIGMFFSVTVLPIIIITFTVIIGLPIKYLKKY